MRQLEQLSYLTACALFLGVSASASDWSNSGGTPGHDCLSSELGPQSPVVIWSGSRPSIIAWQPVTESNRLYMVRSFDLPPGSAPNDSPIVCQNLTTGLEQWSINVPYNAGEWITWVGGVSGGRLYASRSSGGAPSVFASLHCYDSTTGAPLWTSTDLIDASPYDGVVFAPNGDPVIGSPTRIRRIDHLTGSTVWVASRDTGTISGCSVAIFGNTVYGANFDQFGGGMTIRRYDLATGTFQYESGSMGPGYSNPPMVGPDGTIYMYGRGPGSNYTFYAWTDTGTAIVPKWNVPAGPTGFAEGGVGPDGSIYHFALNSEIHRLDPATGATLSISAPLPFDAGSPRIYPRFAIDAVGTVFLTNGEDNAGILASYNADLSPRWSVSFPFANLGGPALGLNGTLLMAGVGTNVVAYRDPTPAVPFCFGDGSGTGCPCGNAGTPGHGCASSVTPSGALLQGNGTASVTMDTLVLSGSSMPNSSALYFQGTSQQASGAGSIFGDGLRCAGGGIVRLGTKQNAAGASQYPGFGDPLISLRGQVPPAGGVRTYQVWYRNAAPFCSPSTFNLTNGVQLTWIP